MNAKLKGSALMVAAGMVLALGVSAPASAAQADRPENVVITPGYDFAVVEFDLNTANATDIVYKTYNAGGSNTATVKSFYPPETRPGSFPAGHYLFVLEQADLNGNRFDAATVTPDGTNWDASWTRIGVNTNAPGTPVATAGSDAVAGHIDVTLDTPSDRATSYEYSTDGGTAWASAPAAVDGVLDLANVSAGTALVPGTEYDVWVRGVNTSGKSRVADAGMATPYVVPGAPTLGAVTTGDGYLTAEVTAEAAPNGRDVTGYQWSADGMTVGGDAEWAPCEAPLDVTKNCVTVTGLANKVAATLYFAGVNLRGTGAWSGTSVTGTPFLSCEMVEAPSVKFAVSKWALTSGAQSALDGFAAALNESNCTGVSLEGHRVVVKKASTNRARLRLAGKRLAAVQTYLENAGVTLPFSTAVVRSKDNRLVITYAVLAS